MHQAHELVLCMLYERRLKTLEVLPVYFKGWNVMLRKLIVEPFKMFDDQLNEPTT